MTPIDLSAETGDQPPAEPVPHAVRRTVVASLCTAVIGSVALAGAEVAVAAWVNTGRAYGGPLPVGLILAAFGKTVATHLLVWCPLMVVCALVVSAIAGRASEPPEPFLWALFIVLAGLAVAPADLALANHDSDAAILLAGGCVVVLAVAAYVVLSAVRRWWGMARYRRTRNVLTCASVALAVGSVPFLLWSPFVSADVYRVGAPAASSAHPAGPNVLLIVLDTVRADRMSCYGCDAPTTPFLDEWANGAIVFDRAVADAIWTVPSHASMFTGLSLRQHGAVARHLWLDDKHSTVADVLASHGYATACFSNNPAISPSTNLAKGFEQCRVVHFPRRLERFSLEFLCEKWGLTPMLPWLDGDYGAALTNKLIAEWLDERPGDGRPFLLFVNYMEAHLPYRIPRRYRRMFMTEQQVDRSYDLRRSVFDDLATALNKRFNVYSPDFITPADREVVKLQYLAAVRYLDDRVGELIQMFERRGLLDRTLVIVTSDHGEYLDTHGMWSHCFCTYNDVTYVPLMIRQPGRDGGRHMDTPVQLSDLYPTIVNAMLGRSDSGPGYGVRDLFAVAQDPWARRIAIVQQDPKAAETLAALEQVGSPVVTHRAQPRTAAVDDRFKYIIAEDGVSELYDIVADPGELHDVSARFPDRASRLAGHIDNWLFIVPQYEPPPTEAPGQISPEAHDALRDLGYIGGQ